MFLGGEHKQGVVELLREHWHVSRVSEGRCGGAQANLREAMAAQRGKVYALLEQYVAELGQL